MANVLVIVKGGRVVGVETDDANATVRVIDQDAEGEVTDFSWPVIQAGELYEKHMLDLGYAGFSVGDTVTVEGWYGTLVGFNKAENGDVKAQVQDEEGNILTYDVSALEWN